jgi:hypothetical protein
MAWTTAMPRETGWYWYKGEDPDIEFHTDGIAIVEVIKQENRLVCRHSNGKNEWLQDSQAQWAGPLLPPK